MACAKTRISREFQEPLKKQKKLMGVYETEYNSYIPNETQLKDKMQRLGLKSIVIEYVEECQNILEYHQTDMYYIMYFIEERLKSPILFGKTIKEKLQHAGLGENIATKFEQFGDDEMFKQQTLSYWVRIYLEENWCNKTTVDPTSIPRSDKWETKNISTNSGEERSIEIIQVEIQKHDDLLKQKTEISRKLKELMGTEASQTILNENCWFHGTTSESAENILKGIELKEGSKSQDFSDGCGFYLSHNYEKPSHLAIQKSRLCNDSIFGCSALLIFEFNKDEYNGWNLDQYNDNCTWENVIKYHRMSINEQWKLQKEELKIFFRENKPNEMKYIYGPVCDGKVWEDASPKKFPNYDQLCILDDDMADEVSNQLKGIIYINIKKST